jgi:hypothetical protein
MKNVRISNVSKKTPLPVQCRKCKKKVEKTATKCPHCGIDNPGITKTEQGCLFLIIILIVMGLWWFFSDKSEFPHSDASYKEVDSQVGCESKFSKDKKADIFESHYRNHWMTWTGRVTRVDAGTAHLDFDDTKFSMSDLYMKFLDNNTGYNLKRDDVISVKFIMKEAGNCLFPFKGVNAIVLP